MEPSNLSGACLDAAAKAEQALNRYVSAYNTWNDCLNDFECNPDSIDPDLQRQWSAATSKIAAAKAAADSVGADVVAETYTNSVPVSAGDVPATVYGGAEELICGSDDLQPAAKEPCARLRTVLEGGVAEAELGDLDDAVDELNVALGLKAAGS